MAATFGVYLEVGARRTFACSVDWPGWARSGKGADQALQALFEYGPRYARALGRTRLGFAVPDDPSLLQVVEHVKGNATTDFGAPGVVPRLDVRTIKDDELVRQIALLETIWKSFDRTAMRARGKTLSKGPRGGGRTLEAIVQHVMDAENAYLSPLGGSPVKRSNTPEIRNAVIDALWARARGAPAPASRRSKKPLWPAPYGLRRVAWHALDHAWEIEDRTTGPRGT